MALVSTTAPMGSKRGPGTSPRSIGEAPTETNRGRTSTQVTWFFLGSTMRAAALRSSVARPATSRTASSFAWVCA